MLFFDINKKKTHFFPFAPFFFLHSPLMNEFLLSFTLLSHTHLIRITDIYGTSLPCFCFVLFVSPACHAG